VDWAKDDHAVSIVAPDGQQLDRFGVAHHAAGLRTLVRRLLAAGVAEVGIERPDGPVVDALRQAGLTVLVIPPAQLRNLRSRYGSAGNKDDRFDAYVLADTVRTDRRRLHPLLADADATTALRSTTRARKDLVGHRVAVANQLRAHLAVVFPAAVGLFADIDSQVSLRFLDRFPHQERSTRKRSTGSRPNAWPPGCAPKATAAAPTLPSCTPGWPTHPAAPSATPPTRTPPSRTPPSRSRWWPSCRP